MPKDPKALLLLAAKTNGLTGQDIKPWHLKASYKFLDPAGKPAQSGTIEEFWAGSKKWKLIVTGNAPLTLTQNESGLYREGVVNQQSALLLLLAKSFTDPIPYSANSFESLILSMQMRQFGSSQLQCLTIKDTRKFSDDFVDPTYCIVDNIPLLRFGSFANDSHIFIRNQIGTFQGRYVPVEISAGVPKVATDLSAHVDLLQTIASVNPEDFVPGEQATLQKEVQEVLIISGLDPSVTFDMEIASHRLHPISRPKPVYPAIAQAAHVKGTVRLRAVIGTDGRIAELHVLDGPLMLRQAALDAVWQWTFEPYFHQARLTLIVAEIAVSF